jgi:hypothetical protein
MKVPPRRRTSPAARSIARAALLLLLCLLAPAARAGETPPVASYDIKARLDADARTVTGEEVVTWVNTSDEPVGELQFHLYMNAFRNEASTFLRERGGVSSSFDGWGWVEVSRIELADGTDLTPAREFIHPDDDNADDRTVMRVALPRPVAPGGVLRARVEFLTRLPRILARSGFRGDYVFAGQWFPKLGVYQKPAGARSGAWNCHQYHLNSEFFADFGDYNVALTVPSAYVVGATGELRQTAAGEDAGTTTYVYAQESVHDFAWSASPRFKRVERLFDPAREVSDAEAERAARLLGVPRDTLALTPVKVTLLMQPEHLDQVERHWKAVADSIKLCGLRFGRYPYRTFTLIDTPANANGGGMEYPTLITSDAHWLGSGQTKDLEALIAHEFAHQYWYGLVANNEFEDALLDEGFANYSTVLLSESVYGEDYNSLPLYFSGVPAGWLFRLPPVSETALNRAFYMAAARADDGGRPAWRYSSGLSYSVNSAFKFALTLKTLENLLGPQLMARVMRSYFERWRFRHPKPQDFFDVVNEVSGRDMTDFFRQAVYGSGTLDYGVEEVASKRLRPLRGQFDDAQKGGAGGPAGYESRVVLRRLGEVVLPVSVKVVFADGKVEYADWDGSERWTTLTFARPSPVSSAEIDPERKILLDINLTNNSRAAESSYAGAAKISARVLYVLQVALQALTAIA